MTENEPEFIQEDDKIRIKFPKPPTQEEFDYWANVLSEAVEYANKKTGRNIHIIGWVEHKES